MPAKYLMSWESKARLWRKTKTKNAYTVSCNQLSKWLGRFVPETKEGSYQAANQWWTSKLTELNGTPPTHQFAEYLALLAARRNWSRRNKEIQVASFIDSGIARVEEGGQPALANWGVGRNLMFLEGTTEKTLEALPVECRDHAQYALKEDDGVWVE